MAREDLQELVENAEPKLSDLEVDDEKFAGEFLFVEILNLSFTGLALPLAVHASPDDGLQDVAFLEARNRDRSLGLVRTPKIRPVLRLVVSNPPPVVIGGRMTISFSERLAKLEEAVASRTQGPKTIRRVVVEVDADLPTEGPDELLIAG